MCLILYCVVLCCVILYCLRLCYPVSLLVDPSFFELFLNYPKHITLPR